MERTFVEISRQNLSHNFQAIQQAVGNGVAILAVVKADAYGHGAVEVARTLEQAGAGWFGVTSISEGIELRVTGINSRVVVLADLPLGDQDAFAEFGLTPVLHSLEQLQEWNARAPKAPLEARLKVHLKFDSGMGRLGLSEACAADAAELLACSQRLELEGLATHFASAEDLSSGQTEEQMSRFAEVVQAFEARGLRPQFLHMANSAGLAYWPQARGSMVRPGLALYGYLIPPKGGSPAPPFQLKPCLNWKAQIIAIKEHSTGVSLGYNATYRTPRAMRIGIVAAGYADGLDRRLSNGGTVLVGGRRVPIVGLVSMDLTLVDLTAAPGIQTGDYVTLIGREGDQALDAIEMAVHCGTTPYEILCGIGKRVTRLYR